MEQEVGIASTGDLDGIKILLKDNELPYEDIGVSNIQFYTIKRGEEVIACGGLEVFKEVALLRSVAVKEGFKKNGLGFQLTHTLLAEAKRRNVEAVYLLTDTALEYFESKGFKVIPRTEAPAAIKSTSEFAELCPDSSALMRKKI